jgi:DNA polymerase sigma
MKKKAKHQKGEDMIKKSEIEAEKKTIRKMTGYELDSFFNQAKRVVNSDYPDEYMGLRYALLKEEIERRKRNKKR